MTGRPPVYCAYCSQRLQLGDRGQLVAVGGLDCTGPRHSPSRLCDRCGRAVHIDFSGATRQRLVDEHGDTHCPAGAADGHSINSAAERTTGRLVLVGFIALCLLAIAYLVAAANGSSPSDAEPAGASSDAMTAQCYACGRGATSSTAQEQLHSWGPSAVRRPEPGVDDGPVGEGRS